MRIKSSEQVVEGDIMRRSLHEFEMHCCVYIENEQQQASPDNALIDLLCDAVRLARESRTQLRRIVAEAPMIDGA